MEPSELLTSASHSAGTAESRRFQASVVSVRWVADDAVGLVLAQPDPPMTYRSGQYVSVSVPVDGIMHTRNYSLAGLPTDPDLEIGVRVIEDGAVSPVLAQLGAGDTIEVSGPHGRFMLDQPAPRRVLLIGGGSGIVPLLGLARAALDAGVESVSLLYGNRAPGTIMYGSEIDRLREREPERFCVTNLLDTGGVTVDRLRVDNADALLRPFFGKEDPNLQDAAYVCGPGTLLEAARASLAHIGFPAQRIRTELFTPPPAPVPASTDELHSVIVREAAEAHTLQVPSRQTVLAAATAAGFTWPSSCLVGDCGECKVRLRSGTVDLTSVEGLTEEEEADGWVLPCVAYPTTDIEISRYTKGT